MPVWLELAIRVLAILVAFLTLPLIIGQTEHKVMAHMQGRLGPMYAGAYHGWAQLVADGVKFVQKEDVTPRAADRAVFRLAPVVSVLPYLVVLLVIPLGPRGLVAQPLDIGLFFVLAIVGVGVVAVLMAAWASANKYALLGGLRAAAQLLAYELPFVLAAASVAMAAGTLSLPGIVNAWQPWWLLWQLPAMFVFFTAGLAEIRRPPFDMPVADSELVFGYLTEYTGLRFAFFLLAEYAGILVVAALTTVLFLGGWRGPFGLDAELGWLWTLIKVFAVAFVIIWLRVAYPRLREDQLQRFCWLGSGTAGPVPARPDGSREGRYLSHRCEEPRHGLVRSCRERTGQQDSVEQLTPPAVVLHDIEVVRGPTVRWQLAPVDGIGHVSGTLPELRGGRLSGEGPYKARWAP